MYRPLTAQNHGETVENARESQVYLARFKPKPGIYDVRLADRRAAGVVHVCVCVCFYMAFLGWCLFLAHREPGTYDYMPVFFS